MPALSAFVILRACDFFRAFCYCRTYREAMSEIQAEVGRGARASQAAVGSYYQAEIAIAPLSRISPGSMLRFPIGFHFFARLKFLLEELH